MIRLTTIHIPAQYNLTLNFRNPPDIGNESPKLNARAMIKHKMYTFTYIYRFLFELKLTRVYCCVE